MKRSAILLSGGMDSAALAFWKRPEWAITIDYGQRPALGEIRAATAICTELGIRHDVVSVDCSALGSGDLAGKAPIEAAPESEWWPFRNQLLVTLAAMRGIALGIDTLMVGSIKSDSFHADGTPLFYERLDGLVSMQEGAMRVLAPANGIEVMELIRQSGIPASLLGWTHSCHKANFACGYCRGCNKSRGVFSALLT